MVFVRGLLGVVLFTSCVHGSNLVQSQAAEDSYDYVIVGGGVSGLVVANRLSEDKDKTVLVIEAGEAYDNPNIRLPYAAGYALNETLYWPDYVSEPEPELGSKTWGARVGRVLGGGSIVNGMIYDRGSAADYDAWEELDNPGWGWAGIYPYFKKGTEFLPPPESLAKEFNITWDLEAYSDGPLKIGIADFQYPDIKDSFAAWKGAGSHMPLDGNNGEAYGASWFPNTMNPRTGERSHARNSYYEPVSERTNLKVIVGTLVTELVFDGNSTSLTAKGVMITDRATNKSTTVYAIKEVVLAAGAINTPKLLQLSGIGPASVLEAAGIEVRLNLEAVGANFQDHPYTMVAFNTSNASFPNPNSLATNATFNASAWQQYKESRSGPYTQARGNALALIPLPQIDEENYQDIAQQVLDQEHDAYLPAIYNGSEKLIAGVKAQRKVLAALYQSDEAAIMESPIGPGPGFALIAHEKPLSRGSITLDPADPHGPPKVFYNALSNPIDKSVLASCVRYIRTVFARPEFARFSPVETAPGAQYTSDEDIISRSVAAGLITPTFAHPGGSCAMMPEELGGCVSPELLVYGVEKLSIVDASILPLLPSQHLQATMYAVGEKAADIIKSRA